MTNPHDSPALAPERQRIEELSHAAITAIQAGDGSRARELLEQALALDPQDSVLRHNLAELTFRSGNLQVADHLFRQLLTDQPGFLPAYRSLLELLDRHPSPPTEPGFSYERAVLWNNYGSALQEAGLQGDAELAYRQAIQLQPLYPHPWSNLSYVLRLQGRLAEAEQASRRALALQPDHQGALVNLGCALTELLFEEEAKACFQKVLELNPENPEARHNLGSGLLMHLLSRSDLAESDLLGRHQSWGGRLVEAARPYGLPPARNGLPRLAFLSSDFRFHSVAFFLEPLLEALDRARFELILYASQPEPGDAVTARIRSQDLVWHPCRHLSDVDLADRIHADGIDLLVELNGHTQGTRLGALAGHPAARQASWLGYPFSTGLSQIDYRITDRWVDPEDRPGPEKPCAMDRCQYVFRPTADAPAVGLLPATQLGGITFGSLNNISKLNESVVETWSRILRGCPGSRLLLKCRQLGDPYWRGRVHGLFAAHGVGSDRLLLRPAQPSTNLHLATYHEIDVALDPFPYNGFTTTCEALWMGVPVVALAGSMPQGRGGLSLLNALGRSRWVAGDTDAYVSLAIALAADLASLASEREGLRSLMESSPLRQEDDHARSFERCVEQMLALPSPAA